MKVDNDLANLIVQWIFRCGNTGKRRAEHRSFDRVDIHSPYRNRLC
jgi:hypothetical protein